MQIQQFHLECLSQDSYLIADEPAGAAIVVDPRRDIGIYLDAAGELGVTITHAVLTHFHADFVAGHIELRNQVGPRIVLSAGADASYDFLGLADGDILELGDVRVQALATPGHTPEGMCLLVFENPQATEPVAVLTGDTLFIGDVGRPDLMASVGQTAEELASSLYDSLHQKLMPLPNSTIVYPGHGAGSLCGRALGDERTSTIGEQRGYNYALAPMDKDEFIQLITADQPTSSSMFGSPETSRPTTSVERSM